MMLALAHVFQAVAVGLALCAFAGLGWLMWEFYAVGRDIDQDRK